MKKQRQSAGISIYTAVIIIFSTLILLRISLSAQAKTNLIVTEPAGSSQHITQPSVDNAYTAQTQSETTGAPATIKHATEFSDAASVSTDSRQGPLAHNQTKNTTSALITKPSHTTQPKKTQRKVLIIIIDDVGYNLFQLEPFLKFPGAISFAILPSLDYTQQTAALIHAAGKEILLHQPMEAIGTLDAGPGAIMLAMDDDTIHRVIQDNLAQLPLARGINNHMGSLVSQNERIIARVLDECRKAGLYYLDSVTVGNSVAGKVSRSMHFRIMERTVFLDNNPDKPSIKKQIREATQIAEKRGYAVMIGHVWSNELAQTLIELYPHLIESGFDFSTISDFLMDFDDDELDFGD